MITIGETFYKLVVYLKRRDGNIRVGNKAQLFLKFFGLVLVISGQCFVEIDLKGLIVNIR